MKETIVLDWKLSAVLIALILVFGITFGNLIQVKYEEGYQKGMDEGAVFGANLLASGLCNYNRTFSCDSDRICGCFGYQKLIEGAK